MDSPASSTWFPGEHPGGRPVPLDDDPRSIDEQNRVLGRVQERLEACNPFTSRMEFRHVPCYRIQEAFITGVLARLRPGRPS